MVLQSPEVNHRWVDSWVTLITTKLQWGKRSSDECFQRWPISVSRRNGRIHGCFRVCNILLYGLLFSKINRGQEFRFVSHYLHPQILARRIRFWLIFIVKIFLCFVFLCFIPTFLYHCQNNSKDVTSLTRFRTFSFTSHVPSTFYSPSLYLKWFQFSTGERKMCIE